MLIKKPVQREIINENNQTDFKRHRRLGTRARIYRDHGDVRDYRRLVGLGFTWVQGEAR